MTQPFIGQIQPFSFNFAPKGWAQCNGQILSIQQNTALFSLLGTFYGGNGTTNFALPNLESRVPIAMGTSPAGNSYSIGESAGEETLTLLLTQLPAHAHTFIGSSANATAGQTEPVAGVALAKAYRASGTVPFFYGPMTTPQPLNPASVANYGQSQSHTNVQPYLAINWCIALTGIFPSRG